MRKFVTGPLARFERRGESPTLPTTVTKLYTVLLRGEGDADLTPPWVHRGGGRLPAGVVRTICGRPAPCGRRGGGDAVDFSGHPRLSGTAAFRQMSARTIRPVQPPWLRRWLTFRNAPVVSIGVGSAA